ncbi:MAG: NAD(P)H-dependent oxidoreductase [Pseudomonadota bacterium]
MPDTKTVLIVIDHPNPASLTHAVAEAFAEGALAAGFNHDICDLHAEGFDPRWSMPDVEERAEDIAAHQARIDASDAVCMAFPLFWYGMPAMMKGWIDRVWSFGWAYDEVGAPDRSLLKDRTGVLLIPAGANPETWQDEGYEAAMRTIWERGTLGYFGFTDKRIRFLGGAHGSDERRANLLDLAYQEGRNLTCPSGR